VALATLVTPQTAGGQARVVCWFSYSTWRDQWRSSALQLVVQQGDATSARANCWPTSQRPGHGHRRAPASLLHVRTRRRRS